MLSPNDDNHKNGELKWIVKHMCKRQAAWEIKKDTTSLIKKFIDKKRLLVYEMGRFQLGFHFGRWPRKSVSFLMK